ncbi:M48 peptidase [Hamiltosporidium magnivora]|uniref:M48 peptidase n=1 Tax=Hamiltosporidium magnivora TaxID=148818 RepID=A0A4Q9KTM3_9MICR|nr:M48 peptidase [Hamiltosporidium magnivora]
MKYSKVRIFYFLCIFFAISVVSYEIIFMKKYINDLSNSTEIFQESKILTQLYDSVKDIVKIEQKNITEKYIARLWLQIYEILTCLVISLIFISKKARKIIFKKLNESNTTEISFLTLKKSEILYFTLFVILIFISTIIKYLLFGCKIGFDAFDFRSRIKQDIPIIVIIPYSSLFLASLFLKFWKRKYLYILIIGLIIYTPIVRNFKKMGDPTIAGYERIDPTTLDIQIQEAITKCELGNDIFVKKTGSFFTNAFFAINFVTKHIILDGGIFKYKYAIEGIISHELGHAMEARFILFATLTLQILTFVSILFIIDCLVSKYFVDENVSRDCSSIILYLFFLSYFKVCSKPMDNILSQIFEFRADSFAKSLSQHIPLAHSLFFISFNKAPFVSSKLYSTLLYTHPSTYDRLKKLDLK